MQVRRVIFDRYTDTLRSNKMTQWRTNDNEKYSFDFNGVSIVFGLVAIIFQQHGFRTWTLIFLITLSGLGITGLFLSYYKNSDPEYLKYDKNRNFVCCLI